MRSSPRPVSMEGRGRSMRECRVHLLELHEDEVPELEEAVAVLVRRARRAARDGLALGRRRSPSNSRRGRAAPSPTDCSHGRRCDRQGRFAIFFHNPRRDLVGRIDRHPQPVLGQRQRPGDVLPGIGDGVFLEVVAKGEIARASRRRCGGARCSRHCRGRCACRRPARISAPRWRGHRAASRRR